MDKLRILLLTTCLFWGFASYAQEQSSSGHDYLYSEEYFDYLIEYATNQEETQEECKNTPEENEDEISIFEFEDEIITDSTPFKLRIEENSRITPYSETFKKEDSKSIIPVGQKFSFVQDTLKIKNKYNSDDYRILAGAEYSPLKWLTFASGLETNYRGFDQNPRSRKFYFTPTLKLSDKISLSFYNKFDVSTKEQDHDIGINISPFKSKFMDFRVYTGITRNPSGAQSESVNFYTNFYFF